MKKKWLVFILSMIIFVCTVPHVVEKHRNLLGEQQTPFTYIDEGYIYHADTEKIPMENFSDNMELVSADIIRQFETYSSFSSQSPDCWYRNFNDSAKAREFIGYVALREINLPWEEQRTQLVILGDKDGNVRYLKLETGYQVNDIRMQAFAYLYTEHDNEPCTHEVILEKGIQCQESVYRTKADKVCDVMTNSANERGYGTKTGHMVVDGILYQLHIAYLEADAKQAEALLYDWAEQFA